MLKTLLLAVSLVSSLLAQPPDPVHGVQASNITVRQVWKKLGVVPGCLGTNETTTCQEPIPFWETGCKLVTPLPGNNEKCFRLYYTRGWGTSAGAGIYYRESADGTTWVDHSSSLTPTTPGRYRGAGVFHRPGFAYYMYAMYGTDRMDLFVSPNGDGINFTLDTTGIITRGSGALDWDHEALGNVHVDLDRDGITWRMLYDGKNTHWPSYNWVTGAATATNPRGPWTKDPAGVVIGDPNFPGVGKAGPWMMQIADGRWVVWTLDGKATGNIPTDSGRSIQSGAWPNFVAHPAGITMARTTADEGAGSQYGQLADPATVQVTGTPCGAIGQTCMFKFYSSLVDGRVAPGSIKWARADMTLEQLVQTDEDATAVTMPNISTSSIRPNLVDSPTAIQFFKLDGISRFGRINTALGRWVFGASVSNIDEYATVNVFSENGASSFSSRGPSNGFRLEHGPDWTYQIFTGPGNVGYGGGWITGSQLTLTCQAVGCGVKFGRPPILASFTIAALPASPQANMLAIFTDAASATDCTVGGGTTRSVCVYDGAAWRKP